MEKNKNTINTSTNNCTNKLSSYLIYFGALPFIALSALLAFKKAEIYGYNIQHLLFLYGTIICGFVCGSHWGLLLTTGRQNCVPVLVLSNVYAICVWLSYLAHTFRAKILLLILIVLLLLGSDKMLLTRNIISANYYTTRKWVTLTVVLCLIVAYLTPQ